MTTRTELERHLEQHLQTETARVNPSPGWDLILERAATGSELYLAEPAPVRRVPAFAVGAAAAAVVLVAIAVGVTLNDPEGEPVATVDTDSSENTASAQDGSSPQMPNFAGLESTVESGPEFDEIDFTTPLGREGTVRLPAGTLVPGPAEHGWEIVTGRPDRHQIEILRGSAQAWGDESCRSGLTLAPDTDCVVTATPLDEGATLYVWTYENADPATSQTSAIQLSPDAFIPHGRPFADRWRDSVRSIGTSPHRPAFEFTGWPIERTRLYLTAPSTDSGLLTVEIGDTCSDAPETRCVNGLFVALLGDPASSELLESIQIVEREAS